MGKIWNNKWDILTGIWNSIFKNRKTERLSKSRMEICNKCPHIDHTGNKCFAPGTQPCCSICGCKLAWKTRVPSEICDAGKW